MMDARTFVQLGLLALGGVCTGKRSIKSQSTFSA